MNDKRAEKLLAVELVRGPIRPSGVTRFVKKFHKDEGFERRSPSG